MTSSDFITPALVLAGVLGSAYLTYLGTTYRYRTRPKDPTTELFNYYDILLRNALEQSREKDALIDKLEQKLNGIQQELIDTQELLQETKRKLAEASEKGEIVKQHISDARVALNKGNKGV
jgi:hypothetical protein